MAISDGAVATFDTKYHYKFWRPETAIRDARPTTAMTRPQPDAAFKPFIVTPCFPGYPSAHAHVEQCGARSDGRDLWQWSVLDHPVEPGGAGSDPQLHQARRRSPTTSTTRVSTAGSTSAPIRTPAQFLGRRVGTIRSTITTSAACAWRRSHRPVTSRGPKPRRTRGLSAGRVI